MTERKINVPYARATDLDEFIEMMTCMGLKRSVAPSASPDSGRRSRREYSGVSADTGGTINVVVEGAGVDADIAVTFSGDDIDVRNLDLALRLALSPKRPPQVVA